MTVTESAMIHDQILDCPREVDVCAVGEVAGHKVVVGVECRTSSRPQSVEWVEAMKGKHDHLETTALVLVSSSGFTKNALKLAQFYGIKAVVPGDVTPGFVGDVVNKVESLVCRMVDILNVTRLTLWLSTPGGVVSAEVPANAILTLTDGTPIGEARELAEIIRQKAKIKPEDMMGAKGTEDYYSVLFGNHDSLEPTEFIEGQVFCLQVNEEDKVAFWPIVAGQIVGQAGVVTGDVALAHGSYDSVDYATGVADVGDRSVHLVVTETADGTKRGALKLRKKHHDASTIVATNSAADELQ